MVKYQGHRDVLKNVFGQKSTFHMQIMATFHAHKKY